MTSNILEVHNLTFDECTFYGSDVDKIKDLSCEVNVHLEILFGCDEDEFSGSQSNIEFNSILGKLKAIENIAKGCSNNTKSRDYGFVVMNLLDAIFVIRDLKICGERIKDKYDSFGHVLISNYFEEDAELKKIFGIAMCFEWFIKVEHPCLPFSIAEPYELNEKRHKIPNQILFKPTEKQLELFHVNYGKYCRRWISENDVSYESETINARLNPFHDTSNAEHLHYYITLNRINLDDESTVPLIEEPAHLNL